MFEEKQLALTVENRNGDAPTVPADEVKINHLIGDTAALEIVADSFREILVELPGQVNEILGCNAARVGRCNKLVKDGKVASRGNYSDSEHG